MATYVDDMHLSPMGAIGGLRLCHMIADTLTELHGMAMKIRLNGRWLHGDHYDVPDAKRALAVKYGAIEVSMRQLAALAFLQRMGQPLGAPESAVERMRTWKHSEGAQLSPK
jgi:hypothetical protein